MPLLVRLTDSQVQAGDGVVAKAADRIQCRWRVGKQMGSGWLAIDQQSPFPDLHIETVDGNAEPGGDFVGAEEAGIVLPPVALDGYLDARGEPEALYGDRQDLVGAVR